MCGFEIDENSADSNSVSKLVPGLYAAGEVAGNVHGNNRFGEISLLDCVVLGVVAGVACAKYVLRDRVKATSLDAHAGRREGQGVHSSAHLVDAFWIAWALLRVSHCEERPGAAHSRKDRKCVAG